MKIGDLVRVVDADGYSFGHGILLDIDPDVNRSMRYSYCSVWMFDFTNGRNMPERTMIYRTDFISPIKTPEEW